MDCETGVPPEQGITFTLCPQWVRLGCIGGKDHDGECYGLQSERAQRNLRETFRNLGEQHAQRLEDEIIERVISGEPKRGRAPVSVFVSAFRGAGPVICEHHCWHPGDGYGGPPSVQICCHCVGILTPDPRVEFGEKGHGLIGDKRAQMEDAIRIAFTRWLPL